MTESVRLWNSTGLIFLAVLLLVPLAFSHVLIPAILEGAWWFAIPYVMYYLIILVLLNSGGLILAVQFHEQRVTLKRIFGSRQVEPYMVDSIYLTSPIPYQSRPAKDRYSWTTPQSILTIRLKDGKEIKLGTARDEIKLRIFETITGQDYRGETSWVNPS